MNKEMHDKIAQELADRGLLMAAGFAGLRWAVIPDDAPQAQVDDMRMAYMAGAQHLFASLMAVLDEGTEPTANDMRKMDLIATELATWAEEMKKSHGT